MSRKAESSKANRRSIILPLLLAITCVAISLCNFIVFANADEDVIFTQSFASSDEVNATFDVYGSGASVDAGRMVFSGADPGMILTRRDDFSDFIVDVKYEVLNNTNSSGNAELGVLLRANAGEGAMTEKLNGMLVGLEYSYDTMQVSFGYYFDGVYEPAGYWDAGWGSGFAARDLRIVVKGDSVAVIIGNWHAYVALDKYFDAGSVGFISKNIPVAIDDFTVRQAPDDIYPALTREQWKGIDTVQTGKAFVKGEKHAFTMALPSDVTITSLTLYRRADNVRQTADVAADGKNLGSWNVQSPSGTSDLPFEIPSETYRGKDSLRFEITSTDGVFDADYYFLVYECADGAFVADSLDVGSKHDEAAHNFTCDENINWAGFWKRFVSTDNLLIISARPGARFAYVQKPSVVAPDIEIDEKTTSIDLADYVTIGKTGFNITVEYSFNGNPIEGSVVQVTENGEFAYGVKVSAIPFNKYSQHNAPAFDPIVVTGKITRSKAEAQPSVIDKSTVYDKIFGGWTGANWGIYAGLDTECKYNEQPNPATEIKWNLGKGYCTDDDTNVEYMFLHMMEVYGVNDIAYEDMPEEWLTHCQNYIWCGNETARNLMSGGLLPPYTGSKQNNSNWAAIDAQIESEIFGMIAPGMLENTYTRSVWWLKSVGDGYSLENAAYYAMLCSNAFVQSDITESLATVSSKILLYSEGRAQSSVDIVNFVVNSYRQKEAQYQTDREIWRQTRQEIYDRYWNGNSVDANMNFALTIMALVYGQNDFEETGRIAVLAGCDNDCNAATACTVAGMMNGFDGLPENLKKQSGYNYLNSRRPGLTDDTFDNITKRIMAQAEEVISSCGGEIGESAYSVLDGAFSPRSYAASEYTRKVTTGESGWTQNGFAKIYNPELEGKTGFVAKQSGAKLSYEFNGTSVGVSAALCPAGGTVEIFVDGVSYGTATLKTDPADGASGRVSMCYGQTLKKIRELADGTHLLEIVALEDGMQYPIEYISIECTEDEYYENLPKNVNYARLKGVKPICSVTTPGVGAGGSPVLSVINDGKYFTDFGNLKQQFDTFLGFAADGSLIEKTFDDYFGYEFDRTFTFGKIVFQEGGHWAGGGWFANGDIRVEVLIDGVWTNVEYSLDKPYPKGNSLGDFGAFGEIYTFTLDRKTEGTGIRIIGTPGGYQKLASCAEMEVYG